MNTEFLIVGQGICGTFLGLELLKAGKSFIVIDNNRPHSASKVASGIINPVTGRRIVKTWMIDALMPFACAAYEDAGKQLGIDCIRQTSLIDFFPTPQMRLAFLERYAQDRQYLSMEKEDSDWNNYLHYDFGYGIITPCYLVVVQTLLHAFRNHLVAGNLLQEESFEHSRLVCGENSIRYKDIHAGKVIFCDGINAGDNPYFNMLPFAPNKGEALIAEIKTLPALSLLKKGLTIVPWQGDLFWIGSSHEWKFENDQPTTAFREKTIAQLKSFLKMPFTITDHWASVRPATLERRPFVGFHPLFPAVGIFNGMGTKGCSLAPYFARQLTAYLTHRTPLLPEADVQRHGKLLSRGRMMN